MYEKNICLDSIDEDLNFSIIIPNEVEKFILEELSIKSKKHAMDMIGLELKNALSSENKYKWLSYNLEPVENACFYAFNIMYDNGNSEDKGINTKPRFEIIGGFFNHIDISLDTICESGEGSMRFASNRIFKSMYEKRDFYIERINRDIDTKKLTPHKKEVLTRIYPALNLV